MPCYQVNLITVDFRASRPDLLEAAIRAGGPDFMRLGSINDLGFARRDIEAGKATTTTEGGGGVSKKIKRE